MIELGQHWEFIAAAYGGAAALVGLLIVWTAFSARSVKRRVAELEAARYVRRGTQ